MITATTHRTLSLWALILHVRKTVALTAAVLNDARVHWLSKSLYIGSITVLLAALLFPESVGDLIAFFGIPGVGGIADIFGIPAEAGFDWVAFAVAAYNLLRLFPTEIVGEHYDRLFRPQRMA
ncbi:MAG TPA: hypothetical protein VKQ30_23515 [Ktedonobacterales bacterium]|nr:hypothetical protein [Ktedonobacterales bacterium]